MFAEVAVPVHIRQTFTYRLPGDMAKRAHAGCCVVVPFGKKLLTGFIVALHAALAGEIIESDIKDVEELVDESPIIARDIMQLTKWMADYYHAPWGECLRTALPAGATVATEQVLTITEAGRAALAQVSAGFSWSSSKLQALELVDVFAREVRRDPLSHIEQQELNLVTLNDDQQRALDRIVARIDERQYATFLLHGVTGSGKTEIYIRAMREATQRGMSALMLVPEIALTPVFSRRLRGIFGDAVAILHSSLSEGERTDEWRRIKDGEARVCIGTRSAVFAPLDNLGIIVVDEEHETSYKQDETPRYHGRDTAIMRALRANAVVVLGSATPSLESVHNATTGKYEYIRLDTRYGNRALAAVETVDMREVFKRHGKQVTFSDELKTAMAESFERGEQVMILLNRRDRKSVV